MTALAQKIRERAEPLGARICEADRQALDAELAKGVSDQEERVLDRFFFENLMMLPQEAVSLLLKDLKASRPAIRRFALACFDIGWSKAVDALGGGDARRLGQALDAGDEGLEHLMSMRQSLERIVKPAGRAVGQLIQDELSPEAWMYLVEHRSEGLNPRLKAITRGLTDEASRRRFARLVGYVIDHPNEAQERLFDDGGSVSLSRALDIVEEKGVIGAEWRLLRDWRKFDKLYRPSLTSLEGPVEETSTAKSTRQDSMAPSINHYLEDDNTRHQREVAELRLGRDQLRNQLRESLAQVEAQRLELDQAREKIRRLVETSPAQMVARILAGITLSEKPQTWAAIEEAVEADFNTAIEGEPDLANRASLARQRRDQQWQGARRANEVLKASQTELAEQVKEGFGWTVSTTALLSTKLDEFSRWIEADKLVVVVVQGEEGALGVLRPLGNGKRPKGAVGPTRLAKQARELFVAAASGQNLVLAPQATGVRPLFAIEPPTEESHAFAQSARETQVRLTL